MTTAQRDAIAGPAAGLLIFNTTTNQHEFFNGTAWNNATGVPAGTLQMFSGNNIPAGWLECNGQEVSRATFASLFAAIGTTWGVGNGATTFNMPDLRGRGPIGAGQGPGGLTNRTLAGLGGEESHVLTVSELAPHTHVLNMYTTGAARAYEPYAAALGLNGTYDNGVNFKERILVNAGPGSFSSATAGGGAGHNIMQPFAVVRFIIKT